MIAWGRGGHEVASVIGGGLCGCEAPISMLTVGRAEIENMGWLLKAGTCTEQPVPSVCLGLFVGACRQTGTQSAA